MKYTILLICLFCCNFHINAQKLYKIEKNGLYGYINPENRVVIDCKYLNVYTDTIINLGFVYNQQTNKIVCFNNKGEKLFNVLTVDNGPDYPNEGYLRILSEEGLIGFADTLGNIVINPIYKFAYPFKKGKAKVTFRGQNKEVPGSNGEYHFWESDNWFYINKKGEKIIDLNDE